MEETLRLNDIREEKRFKELIANISYDLSTAIKGYQQLMQKGELTQDQQMTPEIKHGARPPGWACQS